MRLGCVEWSARWWLAFVWALTIVSTPLASEAQRCRTRCRADEQRDERGCCQVAAVIPANPCEAGQTRLGGASGQCCWAGQVYVEGRCRGVPSSCPATHVLEAVQEQCVQRPCEGGRVRANDGRTCCWAGQVAAEGVCRGVPTECPREHRAVPEREQCERLEPCAAGLERADDGSTCCWPGQRAEGARCVGLPSACPSGQHPSVREQRCVADVTCSEGRVDGGDHERCCWPGQRTNGERCEGTPTSCAAGQHPRGEECAADTVCSGSMVIQQDREHCCLPGQRFEGGRCVGDRECPPGLRAQGDRCLRVEQLSSIHAIGPAVLVLGGVTAGAMIIPWIEGGRLTSTLQRDCRDGCPSNWRTRAADIRQLDTIATGLLYAGAGIAVLGGVLTATVRNRSERMTPVLVHVEPGGVSLSGRF